MLSAWKAKMNTSVASSATTVTGWKTDRNFSNQSVPLVRISEVLDDDPGGQRDHDEEDHA